MTAIKLDLAALIRMLPTDPDQPSTGIKGILKLVDDTIHSVRKISTELRPGILDDLGLVAAVEWAAEEFQARTGIQCRATLPSADIAMAPEAATSLFRILQGALTNVARHANATEVNMRLAEENGNLTLQIDDNGQGFGEERLSAGSSLGILGMRERALLLGGEFTISSAPGKVATVSVRIPRTLEPGPLK